MTYSTRKSLYQKIETIRKRPLLVYVTSSRMDHGGVIGADVIPEFCSQISVIPKENKKIDLLIVSNGGDPTTAWRIMSLLRNRFKDIAILLPYQAYSAATLMALGADKIYMHPYSNLGPVDPQLRGVNKAGRYHEFSADIITHYINFVKDELHIENRLNADDKEALMKSISQLCEEVTPLDIGTAQKSTRLSISLGEKLLRTHMKEEEQIKNIAQWLTKSYYHHGYSIGRDEARAMGLPVCKPNSELENILWEIWLDFEEEMQCRDPYFPLKTALEQPEFRKAFSLPEKDRYTKEDYDYVLRKIPQGVTSVVHTLIHASLESTRMGSAYESVNNLTIRRLPDLNLQYAEEQIYSSWNRKET